MRVPEFTSEKYEKMKLVLNSCISELDRIGIRVRRKSCAVRLWEGGRHSVSKLG